VTSPEVHPAEEGTAAVSGAAAVLPLDGPAVLAEPAGCSDATVPDGEDGVAASDVPATVVRLIRREAYMFDAMGGQVARPPADIQCRLRFFHHTNVTLGQVVAVLRSGRGRRW
jgi:hypothetical protein